MIPAVTPLSPETISYIRSELPTWARDAEIPDGITWVPDSKMKGVAYSTPFFFDDVKGSVIIPIRMEPNAVHGEHLHVGLFPDGEKTLGEGSIFLPGPNGALVDASGRYASTTVSRQSRWSIHTPRTEGNVPAVFIAVAHGGILMTGMEETFGAYLLDRFEMGPEQLDRYFDGVPAYVRAMNTRLSLLKILLGALMAALEQFPDDISKQREVADQFFTKMSAFSAVDRVNEALFQLSQPYLHSFY